MRPGSAARRPGKPSAHDLGQQDAGCATAVAALPPWQTRNGCRRCPLQGELDWIVPRRHATRQSASTTSSAKPIDAVTTSEPQRSRRSRAWSSASASTSPPPAPTPRTLTLKGGFTVLDSDQRRLHQHADAQGHSDLGSYLLARAQQQGSPAQLARELHTTTTVVRHLLDQAGITPSPRQVTAAHKRRNSTDQQLTTRAADLGFASLRAYLTDRAMTRRWPTTSIASELRVHPATVRDRLDQHGLPRQPTTVRPHRAIQRQAECWAAKRQAHLAGLGLGAARSEGPVELGGCGLAVRELTVTYSCGDGRERWWVR